MTSTLLRETEFVIIQSGPLKGKRVTGSCGPNAGGGAARRAAQNDQYTTSWMVAWMYAHGFYDSNHVWQRYCDSNGVTTPGKLNSALKALGFTTVYSGFIEPWAQSSWQPWLKKYVHDQRCSVIVEGSACQAYHDLISGDGENARNLQYHFVTLLEYHPGGMSARAKKLLPEGYWVADGDNFAVGNVLQFYSIETLAAIKPVAAVAVAQKVSVGYLDSSDAPAPVSPAPAPSPAPVPAPSPKPAPTGGTSTVTTVTTYPQLALSDPEVARYFQLASDGKSWEYIVKDSTGKVQPMLDPFSHQPILLSGAILSYYAAMMAEERYHGLYALGLPKANPMPIPGITGATYQPFQLGGLADDAAHAFDSRPGMTSASGPVYPLKMDVGPCLAFFTSSAIAAATAPLQATINTLTGDKASLSQQLQTAQGLATALQAKLTKVTESVKGLVALLG